MVSLYQARIQRELLAEVLGPKRDQEPSGTLVLDCLDDPFHHGNAAMLAHRPIPRPDRFTLAPVPELLTIELLALVAVWRKSLARSGTRSLLIHSFLIVWMTRSTTAMLQELLPDSGRPGRQEAYVLLRRAMVDDGLFGFGLAVPFGREELVVLRPVEKLLAISTLEYKAQVRAVVRSADQDVTLKLPKIFPESTVGSTSGSRA